MLGLPNRNNIFEVEGSNDDCNAAKNNKDTGPCDCHWREENTSTLSAITTLRSTDWVSCVGAIPSFSREDLRRATPSRDLRTTRASNSYVLSSVSAAGHREGLRGRSRVYSAIYECPGGRGRKPLVLMCFYVPAWAMADVFGRDAM